MIAVTSVDNAHDFSPIEFQYRGMNAQCFTTVYPCQHFSNCMNTHYPLNLYGDYDMNGNLSPLGLKYCL